MSGAVMVLAEPGCFVVACFVTDCPEHGLSSVPPWVDEHETKAAANASAASHRAYIRDYWKPDPCPSCGQRIARSDSGAR